MASGKGDNIIVSLVRKNNKDSFLQYVFYLASGLPVRKVTETSKVLQYYYSRAPVT